MKMPLLLALGMGLPVTLFVYPHLPPLAITIAAIGGLSLASGFVSYVASSIIFGVATGALELYRERNI